MTQTRSDILIIGTGQAGAQAALSLRQEGFGGSICMLGEERDLPYERPPLSKEYLAGERTADRLLLRQPLFWAERDVEIRTGVRIARVEAGRAHAEDGAVHEFGTLVWAAGGHARRLSCPGAGLSGVHVIRSRQDCDDLRADLNAARQVVVVGGGYVGLEAAAVLAKAGKSVTVVEAQPRLLARVAGPEVSAHYKALHEAHGVRILLDVAVAALEGQGQGQGEREGEREGQGRVAAVRLADGTRLPADLVIAGIGLVPSVAPLGIAEAVVDAHCRTALPNIYAIGDCATHPNRFAGGASIRLESVQNAVDMAKTAAAHIVHGDGARPYDACPWFWSNQYDVKLQTVGLSMNHDARVVRGDPASGSWSLVYLRAGAVIALDCINAARDYVQGKALVERGARIPPDRLADAGQPLKSLEG
jgi:3-phenylpropionate/trans-cinnamate dioxygenase ferredoxin reductase component